MTNKSAQKSTEELKQALIKTLLTKRGQLQRLYQKKRQIKLIEKRQRQQEKALGRAVAQSKSQIVRCTLQP